MSEFIVASYDKSVKFVLRIQMGIFIIHTVDLVWSSHFILCRLFPFYILFQNKADIIRMIKHLGDGYLKKTLIFGRNIIQGMCLVRGNDDTYYIIYHIVKF